MGHFGKAPLGRNAARLSRSGDRGDRLPAPLREAPRPQVWARPLALAPASPRFYSALRRHPRVPQVTGDGSLGSSTGPLRSSARAAWEARPAPAASFTSLGAFQGNARMLI